MTGVVFRYTDLEVQISLSLARFSMLNTAIAVLPRSLVSHNIWASEEAIEETCGVNVAESQGCV
jgi:hypothetical protein